MKRLQKIEMLVTMPILIGEEGWIAESGDEITVGKPNPEKPGEIMPDWMAVKLCYEGRACFHHILHMEDL